MEENMNNVADEVMENVDTTTEIVESSGSGANIALGAALVAVGAAAVYGTVTAVKKGISWAKRRKLKKEAEQAIDNVDSFEDFEDYYEEQVNEIHEVK